MADTWADVCRDALRELNIFDASAAIANDELVFVLGKANRILDNWNAERQAVYAEAPSDFTLTANHNPHMIGLTANAPDWTVSTNRPVSIEAASINIGGSPNAYIPLEIRDADWYEALTVPGLASSLPTDLYYEAAWPNGKVYLYPVPSAVYTIRLWLRTVLAQVSLTTALTLPPGYRDAITLTLTEDIAAAYTGQPAPPDIRTSAAKARARIFANNEESPRYLTADSGIPTAGGVAVPGGKTYLTRWQ